MKRKHGLTPIQRIERYRTYTSEGCWECSLVPGKSYPQIKIGGSNFAVHRIAYEALVGPIPEGMFVCHHCDNKRCHNPNHLFLGTNEDNMADMASNGRAKNGAKPKISHKDICEIAKKGGNLSQMEIASMIGCSQATVSKVLREQGLSRGVDTTFRKARIGTAHHKAKLTENDVRYIRNATEKRKALAEAFGVSLSTITAIQLRNNWGHVTD